jgi:Na+-transporting methylmalonyl-CoA/oxaloacetate decarboxylase beta subunit
VKKIGIVLLALGVLCLLGAFFLPIMTDPQTQSQPIAIIGGADGPAAVEITQSLIANLRFWHLLSGGILLIGGAVTLLLGLRKPK